MSNRYHNKWHRQNHHSWRNPAIPDSGHDPIASKESPFRGEFYLSGGVLSAHNPNEPYAGIFDDNIFVKDAIYTTNLYATQNISADYLEVNYMDVKYYETSGFGISGSDYRIEVPSQWQLNDTLTLDGIGLSTTSWVAIGGDLKVYNNINVLGEITTPYLSATEILADNLGTNHIDVSGCLNTNCINALASTELITINGNISTQDVEVNDLVVNGCIATDCIGANDGSEINIYNDTNMNNNDITNVDSIDAVTVNTTNIYATNYFGLTTDNIQVTLNEGWNPETVQYHSATPSQNSLIRQRSIHYGLFNSESDNLITTRIAADNYDSYGVVVGLVYLGGTWREVAKAKVGNIGLIPNSNVDHALSAGMWIDNEQTMSFIAPSGSDWMLSAVEVYGTSIDVNVTVMESNVRLFNFAGSTLTFDNIVANSILTDTLTATGQVIIEDLSGNTGYFNIISAACGNSEDWCSAYTIVQANSADNWDNTSLSGSVLSLEEDVLWLNTEIDSLSTTTFTLVNNTSSNILNIADMQYVNISGDTMSGPLSTPVLSADEIFVGNDSIYFESGATISSNASGVIIISEDINSNIFSFKTGGGLTESSDGLNLIYTNSFGTSAQITNFSAP